MRVFSRQRRGDPLRDDQKSKSVDNGMEVEEVEVESKVHDCHGSTIMEGYDFKKRLLEDSWRWP